MSLSSFLRAPLRGPGPNQKRYAVPIVVLAAVLVTAAIVIMSNKGKGPAYVTEPVRTGDIVSTVQATGTVNPIHTIAIGSQVSGMVVKILTHFNSVVKQGQLLAQIDPTIYQNQVDSAQSSLINARAAVQSAQAQVVVARANETNARAGIEQAQAALNVATMTWNRTHGLYQQGIDSASQRDTDLSAYQTAEAGLAGATAGLRQSEAQLRLAQAGLAQAQATVATDKSALATAQTNLDYCNIYAPANGTIIDREVDVGQTVAASYSTPNMFTEATDLTTMYVYAQTDESDVGRLQDGQDATFTVDAFPNTVYHGVVLQRRMAATTLQNVVEYDTIIEFDNVGRKLFPGMTAYINVPVARAINALEVPNAALRFKPNLTPAELRATLAKYDLNTGSGTGSIVWKLDANGSLVPVRVAPGITNFTYTAINRVLQGSLKNGDAVVTRAAPTAGS